jgi:hypothetical protein
MVRSPTLANHLSHETDGILFPKPMSIRMMTRVWDDKTITSATERLVLLALADYSNDDGKSWPSIARIAERSLITERALYRVLARLKAAGKVAIQSGAEDHRTNVYTLTLTNGIGYPDPKSPYPDPPVRDTLTLDTKIPDSRVTPTVRNRQRTVRGEGIPRFLVDKENLTTTEKISLEKSIARGNKRLTELKCNSPYPSGSSELLEMKWLRQVIREMQDKLGLPV